MPPGRPSNRDSHRDNSHDDSAYTHGHEKHAVKKPHNNASHPSKPTHAQQQYIKNILIKHVTRNHPDNDVFKHLHPLDFEAYSDDFLRKYKDKYNLPIQSDNMSLQGYLLNSVIGTKTESWKKNNKGLTPVQENSGYLDADKVTPAPSLSDQISYGNRVEKKVLVSAVKKHFQQNTIKENECIPQFIYKIKNDKKKFKMEF